MRGRVAVVTGAAQGIGRAYALALAEDGATVVAADLNAEGAEETAALVAKEGGEGIGLPVDVSDRESVRRLAEEVRRAVGPADVLVNNAAIYHSMRIDSQLTVDIDYWRKMFSVNLDGALLCTQAFAPAMIERKWGRIVNQTSIGAYLGGGGPYGCSKLALIGLTQGFATELGQHGITVNAIAPGVIWTEATQVTVPEIALDMMQSQMSIKRKAMPEDLVGALRFLVSDASAWMTGQTLIVDGGQIKRV